MSKNQQALIWAVLSAAIVAFGQELAAGRVPLPPELAFLSPVLVAAITTLTPNVRRGK